jgi:hypothetical protein
MLQLKVSSPYPHLKSFPGPADQSNPSPIRHPWSRRFHQRNPEVAWLSLPPQCPQLQLGTSLSFESMVNSLKDQAFQMDHFFALSLTLSIKLLEDFCLN